jgi:Phosphodiester glycosidase
MRTRSMIATAIAGTILLVGLAGFATVYAYAGWYGVNSVFKRGGTVWARVAPDDLKLPSSMQFALQEPAPVAVAGYFSWREVSAGFEVAELPVLAHGKVVDRLLLARIDPAKFRFVVRTSPAGDKTLSDWMHTLHPALVINGSYFGHDGRPDTPLISAGVRLGPRSYPARHGAFIASSGGLFDLRESNWQTLFRGADDALVSYPLLVAEDGTNRVKADPHWLANRSFVAKDGAGRVIFGTTAEAFFSLDRLAGFLRQAPLDIKIALNLDGGPVACQGIELSGYRRDFCGDWEVKTEGGELKLLQRVIGHQRWGLPIVIEALPR